jgi:hypothetical protein
VLDRTVVYPLYRWLGLALLLCAFVARVWALQGWFIVTYGLGIFLLNLFIGFITPQVRAAGRGWAGALAPRADPLFAPAPAPAAPPRCAAAPDGPRHGRPDAAHEELGGVQALQPEAARV